MFDFLQNTFSDTERYTEHQRIILAIHISEPFGSHTSFMGHSEKPETPDLKCPLIAPDNHASLLFWPFDFVTITALRWLLENSPS